METGKGMTNLQIAELLRDVAAAYQLKDPKINKFRIVAYQRAADAIEHATSELKDLWDDGKLGDVPGVGTSIAEHLDELFRTGKSKHFNDVTKDLPPVMFEFMKIPGIGAKIGFKLATELKLKSVSDLEKAAENGLIAKLEGFGKESQASILKSIKEQRAKKSEKRHLIIYATNIAQEIIEYMTKNPNVLRIDPLGSLRRKVATVGDIDLSVATKEPLEVLEYFTKYPKAQRILEKGAISSSIIVPGGIQVDLMVQPIESYGSLLQHFTGSKHHNIALREYALKKGFSLSEKGIKIQSSGEVKRFKDEESFYKFLGLDYIEPELREDVGEIEAAREHKLPKLLNLQEIKADLQIHSSFDIETSHDIGENSMEEIIQRGNDLGYEYLAFTEHNPSQKGHTEKQIVEILKKKHEKVEQLNYSLKKSSKKGIQKVFNSLEIDILPDGRIPVPGAGMELLDFALVSIHSSFSLGREQMTKRVLSALSHPKVKIFAHPTARKLNEREGIELNWSEIFEFCLKNDKWIEINAEPSRLDLPDTLVHEAVKLGIKLSLGTDSHSAEGLSNMQFGVSVARRGWAEARDIMNTRTLTEFEKLLK